MSFGLSHHTDWQHFRHCHCQTQTLNGRTQYWYCLTQKFNYEHSIYQKTLRYAMYIYFITVICLAWCNKLNWCIHNRRKGNTSSRVKACKREQITMLGAQDSLQQSSVCTQGLFSEKGSLHIRMEFLRSFPGVFTYQKFWCLATGTRLNFSRLPVSCDCMGK